MGLGTPSNKGLHTTFFQSHESQGKSLKEFTALTGGEACEVVCREVRGVKSHHSRPLQGFPLTLKKGGKRGQGPRREP